MARVTFNLTSEAEVAREEKTGGGGCSVTHI
jgi:hypothetical protein